MQNPFKTIFDLLNRIYNKLVEQEQLITSIQDSSQQPQNEERYIDKRDAARIAGVSISSIDNWRRSGKIIPYYFDSAVRFKYVEFVAFLDSQKKGSNSIRNQI